MKKVLAALGVLVLVILVLFLRRELESPAPAATPEPAKTEPVKVAQAADEPKPEVNKPAVEVASPTTDAKAAAEPSKDKMDPSSDEFFFKHDEIVIPMMMRQAVKCWENLPPDKRAQFHRNQSMVATFKQRIRNGVVTIHDLEVTRTSIKDPALEACFVQQLRSTTWTNERLPDWDQEDTIKLGPRTLKKYTRENIEADGPEAPPQ
jgi:hypothetical protein